MERTSVPTPRRRRRARTLLWIVLVLLVVVVILIALAPMIAAPFVRPAVQDAVNDQIRGETEIRTLELSWFGSQRVALKLDDPDGDLVADVTVRVDKGLLPLAFGDRDLGEIYVGGSARVVREADGQTNLMRAVEPTKPAAPPKAEPTTLPEQLAASIVFDGLEVLYRDAALAEQTAGQIAWVRLGSLRGEADFAVGTPIELAVSGPLSTGAEEDALVESGSVDVRVTLTGLTDTAGRLTPETLAAEFALELTAPVVALAAAGTYADATVTTTGQPRLAIDGGELAELFPRVREAMATAKGVTVTELPDMALEIRTLRLPIGGDLSGASLDAALATSASRGTVEVQRDGQTTSTEFTIEPLRLTVAAPRLSETIAIEGTTNATIGGESAGAVAIDLTMGGLLDAAGGVRGLPETMQGGLRVDGFSTPILQPFVAAMETALPEGIRIDLPQDVGPRIDLTLDASTPEGSSAYDLDLAMRAERAELAASIVVDGQTIATRGDGVRGRFSALAPVLDRFTEGLGVRVQRGADTTFHITDMALDLARMTAPETGLDLRGARVKADVATAGAIGTMLVRGQQDAEGQPAAGGGEPDVREYRLEQLSLGIATDDLAGEVGVTGSVTGQLGGEPLGTVAIDMALSGLLTETGDIATASLPMVRGEARVEGLAMATVDALFGDAYAGTGLDLTRDVGPRADLVVLAESMPEAGQNATSLSLTFRSQHIDATAPLLVTPTHIRSRGAVTLVDRSAGRTLAALMAENATVRVQQSGTVRLAIENLDVPIGEGGVRPDRVAADIRATLSEFAADVTLPAPEGGEAAQPARLGVPELVVSAAAVPGEPPRVSADGRLTHADEAFTLQLEAVVHRLFREGVEDPAGALGVLTLQEAVPVGSFALRGVPATLARALPRGMVKVGEENVDVVLLARDTLGRTFDITGSTERAQRNDTTAYGLQLAGERADWRLNGRYRSDLFTLDRASGTLGVTTRVAAHLMGLTTETPILVEPLREPATIAFALNDEFELPLGEGFAPVLESDAVLDATVTIDAALAEFPLPGAAAEAGGAQQGQAQNEAGEPLTLPPVRVQGLSIALRVPTAGLTDAGGAAQAQLQGTLLREDGASIATLAGGAELQLRGGALVGDSLASVRLNEVDAFWIDELLEQPALVSGALGERFSVALEAQPTALLEQRAGSTALSIAIDAPRFVTEEPVRVAFNQQAIFLENQLRGTWTMGPRWANLYLFGAQPGGPAPALALTEQTRVQLAIERLALAKAQTEGEGFFKPGVFLLVGTVTAPEVAAQLSDGRAMRAALGLRLARGQQPDQLGFTLSVPRIAFADQPEVAPKQNEIRGTISSFADASGNLTPDTARISAIGGISPVPTALIDAVARQNNLFTDLLGTPVDFTIDASDFGLQGGRLRATATAPFARADIRGTAQDGTFIVDPASVIEATQITQAATNRLQKAIPPLATLEKTQADDPARIIFETPITVPMDKNFDRLNGRFTVDIGTARYGTAGIFSKLLKAAQLRNAGEVGRRLPPLTVTMMDGLVSYDRYGLPLGEFTVETQGFINLSSRPRRIREGGEPLGPNRLEVITIIPAGAVASEAVPALSGLPLPVVGDLARLPVRTSGLISEPNTSVASDLVGKETIRTFLTPARILEQGAGGVLDILGGGKKKDEQKQQR